MPHWPPSFPSEDFPLSHSLEEVRGRIDAIDRELRKLLDRRAACAIQASRIRAREPEDEAAANHYRPAREARILRRIRSGSGGAMPPEAMARLFREIMSCCLWLEQPVSVACLGPQGTFSEEAAVRQFGHFASLKRCAVIEQVFREVEADRAHYGVVPVENTTEGMVNQTLDGLVTSSLGICGELELPVHQMLCARGDADPQQAEEIVSHTQSFAQTRRWLDTHHPGVPRRPVSSSGEAARLAAASPSRLAIANSRAAELFGLRILHRNIEDHPGNRTRFLTVGKSRPGVSGRDKTSILVTAKDAPGSLYAILGPFEARSVNMTRLETRPLKGSHWAYQFFIDFVGHRDEDRIAAMLKDLADLSVNLRVLGSYPAAPI